MRILSMALVLLGLPVLPLLGCRAPHPGRTAEMAHAMPMPPISFTDARASKVLRELDVYVRERFQQPSFRLLYLSTETDHQASLRYDGGTLEELLNLVCMAWNLRSIQAGDTWIFLNREHGDGLHEVFLFATIRDAVGQPIGERVTFVVREPTGATLERRYAADGVQVLQVSVPISIPAVEMGGYYFFEPPRLPERIVLDVYSAGHHVKRHTVEGDRLTGRSWLAFDLELAADHGDASDPGDTRQDEGEAVPDPGK